MDERQIFTGTAEYYAQYRKPYPKEFFDHIVTEFGLDGKGRLLDLGCGTGLLSIPFSKYFDEVIGLDIEQEMLDQAAKEIEKAGVRNITLELRKAEDIGPNLGTFRLTTMGASFHWMDQKVVLEKVYDVTEKGGGVVIVSSGGTMWSGDFGEEWNKVRKAVIQKYLGEERRAGNSLRKKPDDFEDSLDGSPFGGCKEWTHEYVQTWTLDQAVNYLYSTSFAAPRLFGDKLAQFDAELRTELLKLEPSGIFKEKFTLEALIARKQ